jgi:hypothetical protein
MTMPQQALDYRRIRRAAMTGQRETLVRPSAAELAAIRQRASDGQALALRRRQLELLKLAAR